jgi:pimeloyl-ACP methyl ester carboxylesterase
LITFRLWHVEHPLVFNVRMTETTKSADGTTIAFERAGSGPALVVTGGALSTRFGAAEFVPLLADHYTVVSWDRRGRGDSGDTLPWSIEREADDLRAVIDAVGGPAYAYGHSSGAILSLEAAARGANILKLAVYEPPYVPTLEGPNPMDDVQPSLDAGDPDSAVKAFLRGTGMPDPEALTHAPFWPGMVALAHTLPYDLGLAGDGSIPLERFGAITVPTLAMDGGTSPDWAAAASVALSRGIPNARRLTVEGQNHAVALDVLNPILRDFFA